MVLQPLNLGNIQEFLSCREGHKNSRTSKSLPVAAAKRRLQFCQQSNVGTNYNENQTQIHFNQQSNTALNCGQNIATSRTRIQFEQKADVGWFYYWKL